MPGSPAESGPSSPSGSEAYSRSGRPATNKSKGPPTSGRPPYQVCLRPTRLDAQRVEVDRLLFVVPLGLLALLLVVVETGSGGDQLADDHVLLETAEAVHLAADRGFGEHPGGLLEGGRREP